MEYPCQLSPINIEPVILIFKNVQNAITIQELFLKNSLIGTAVDLINVYHEFHIKLATHKALWNEAKGSMKTKNITSEILYHLSPSTKINDAILKFTPSENSKDIATIIIIQDNEQIQNLKKIIDGAEVEISYLNEILQDDSKKENMIKSFKITKQELEVASLIDIISSRISTKDIL